LNAWSAWRVLDGGEAPDPEQVLLQYPDEALGAAIALGLTYEGGRRLDAEEGELGLEVVGDVLAAVVVAQLEAAATPSANAPKRARTPWRIGSSASKRGVDADALVRAMVDGERLRPDSELSGSRSDRCPTSRRRSSVRMVPSCALGPCGRPTRPLQRMLAG
jgi:hypothetical protein